MFAGFLFFFFFFFPLASSSSPFRQCPGLAACSCIYAYYYVQTTVLHAEMLEDDLMVQAAREIQRAGIAPAIGGEPSASPAASAEAAASDQRRVSNASAPPITSLLDEAASKPKSKLLKKRAAANRTVAFDLQEGEAASAPAPAPAPHRPRIFRQRRADTNVVAISLGTLAQDAFMETGDPIRCKQCRAYFSALSQSTPNLEAEHPDTIRNWTCEFCGTLQIIYPDREDFQLRAATVDYMLEPATLTADALDNAVVFCIDTSGSMCVTTEVVGKLKLKGAEERERALAAQLQEFGDGSHQRLRGQGRDVTYVSRLQCVQTAVDQQFEDLSRLHPNTRCGLISFADDVTLYGDCATPPVVIAGDWLSDYDATTRYGKGLKLHFPVCDSKAGLSARLFGLQDEGRTALGPALLAAVACAGQRPASKVILCTDGLANVGLGSIDETGTDAGREATAAFYRRVGDYARETGVAVTILSIEGSDCSLENIGAVADATGGTVDIVNPVNLEANFASVLADPIIATNVKLEFRLHEAFRFREDDLGVVSPSLLERVIGNVTASSDTTLEYGVRREYLARLPEEGSTLPFQVVISYTRLDGMKCVRVITQQKTLTRDRSQAEAEVDVSVLGLNQMQHAAKMMKKGEYGQAQRSVHAGVVLMSRVAKTSEAQAEFVNYVHASEGLDQAMRKEMQQEYDAGLFLSDSDDDEALPHASAMPSADADARASAKSAAMAAKMAAKSSARSSRRTDDSARAVYQTKNASKSAISVKRKDQS